MTKRKLAATKRRRGRPPKPPNQRRIHTLAFRINDETYQKLRVSAEANGRSLSEEAEVLLYGAFDAHARTHEALVGMVARGEAQLLVPTVPTPTIPGTALVVPPMSTIPGTSLVVTPTPTIPGTPLVVPPTPTIPGTFVVAPTGAPPLYLTEAAGAAGSKPSGTDESVESYRRIAKFLAAAFLDKEVVAAAREMLKTAVGEVREEVAAGPDPGGGTRSRRKVTGRADST